jgi:hypothetical protein
MNGHREVVEVLRAHREARQNRKQLAACSSGDLPQTPLEESPLRLLLRQLERPLV